MAEDVIQINHARATGSVGGAGNETRNARYFVVDSVEALSKFGGAGKLDEAWCVLVRNTRLVLVLMPRFARQGSCGLRHDDRAGVAVQAVQVERAEGAVPQRYARAFTFASSFLQGCNVLIFVACRSLAVKGVYPQWTADPPNAKIRSWNVSELRVRTSVPLVI